MFSYVLLLPPSTGSFKVQRMLSNVLLLPPSTGSYKVQRMLSNILYTVELPQCYHLVNTLSTILLPSFKTLCYHLLVANSLPHKVLSQRYPSVLAALPKCYISLTQVLQQCYYLLVTFLPPFFFSYHLCITFLPCYLLWSIQLIPHPFFYKHGKYYHNFHTCQHLYRSPFPSVTHRSIDSLCHWLTQ